MCIAGTDITVNEQLVPFRGRCPFRQYFPSKPAKHGIKIWWTSDSYSVHRIHWMRLWWQSGSVREQNPEANVLTQLIQPWYRSRRNVVGDSLFTGIPLAHELLLQGLTCVDTIRKKWPDISSAMMAEKRSELYSGSRVPWRSRHTSRRKGKNYVLFHVSRHSC